MRVAHVGSEVFPFSRSGGLGDVLGALPNFQANNGDEIIVISPWYLDLNASPSEIWRGRLPELDAEAWVGEVLSGNVRYLFVGLADFQRHELYHSDDVRRFSIFSRSVLPVLRILGAIPDIIHGHDWQAGLAVTYGHLAGIRTVFTIHNLQYQGCWNLQESRGWTGLPDWAFGPDALEFFGDISLIKAGLVFSDRVTTVSPNYAKEITTPAYGEKLEGLLESLASENRLTGILNGLDQERWNPRTDLEIKTYGDFKGKAEARNALYAEFNLDTSLPVLAAVSRLADQKGMDLLIKAMPQLTNNWNVVVLGSGDPLLTSALMGWSSHPRVGFFSGMNEALAHRVYAGADAFVMPSRFEPCGLSQMIAMRYGALPVVRETGGLVDTVPHDVGFRFAEATTQGLLEACSAALETYGNEEQWIGRVEKSMQLNFDWSAPAAEYLKLYSSLL